MIKKIEINKVLEEIEKIEKLEKSSPTKSKIIRKVEVIEEERKVFPREGHENENENINFNKVGCDGIPISKNSLVEDNSKGSFDKADIVITGAVLGVISVIAWGTMVYLRNVRK